MSRVEEAVKAYSLLFSLPSAKRLALLTIALSIPAIVASPRTLQAVIAWALTPFLAAILTYLLSRSELLTWKRCLGASTFSFMSQVATYILISVLLTGKVALLASTALFTAIHATVIQPLAKHRALGLIPAPLAFIALSSAYAATYNAPLASMFKMLAASQTMGAGLAFLAILAIEEALNHREGSLKYFKAFAYAWMANDPSQLEAVLTERAELARINVTSVVFKSQRGVEGCFLTFNAHPGPFRNVAGSNLPADVAKAVEREIGGTCLVFHSTATHDRDPANKEEANKIIKTALYASMSTQRPINPLYTQPACSMQGEPYVCCQVLGIPIITVTWRSQKAEDLPHTHGEELIEGVKARGFHEALIIEAHNNHPPGPVTPPSLTHIKQRALEALNKACGRSVNSLRAAFTTLPLKGLEGLGDGGVKLALIEAGSSRSLYILIDANNLSPTLHQALLSELSKQGLEYYEAYTTDTHSVVGLKPIKGGYTPFGERLPVQAFTSMICDELKSLANKLVEVEVEVGSAEVEVKVIGEQGLNTLMSRLKKGLRAVKIVLPLTYFICLALSLLIASYLL